MSHEENKVKVIGFLEKHPGYHPSKVIGAAVFGQKRGSAMIAANVCRRMEKDGVIFTNGNGEYSAV